MMKKQRLLTLAIVICLLACLFTACDITFDLGTDITITFMVDGEVYHEMEVKNDKTVRMPAEPEKDGYVFAGWYLSEDYEEVFTSSYLRNNTVVADITVYAKWVEDDNPPPQGTFTIHFNSMGGSEVADIVLSEGATFVLPDDPTKTGYTFAGWYLDESYQTIFESTSQLMDGIVLYAKWVEEHEHSYTTTTFAPDCENDGYTRHSCECGHYYDDTIVPATGHTYEDTTVPPTPTEQGYTLHQCKKCGHSYKDNFVDAIGHSKGLAYSVNSDGETCTITGIGSCTQTVLAIPEEIDGYAVTTIGASAFRNCDSLTSVTFGSNSQLTTIGSEAFYWCTSLTSITIPDSVTTIGSSAFYNCSSLTSITIPDSVTTIGSSAFSGCTSLTSVTIGDSVTSIGEKAFYWCTSLTSISVDENNPNYKSIDGNLYSKDGKTLVQYAIGKTATSFVIPDSVTTIGEYAFYNCTSLTSVTIGDSVTTIGSSAFSSCDSLTNVTFGENSQLTSIGSYAFLGCTSLTSVTFGANSQLTSIGSYAFSSCDGLTSIVIPDSVTTIGSSAFEDCTSLTSISVDENNPNYKSIDGNLYSKDGKTLIQYAIGKTATSFVIPDSVTTIGSYAFAWCNSLTSIIIPDSVTSIGASAFYRCTSLTSITIPDSVTTIGNFAFYNCTSLTSIIIPDSVTSIGSYAFAWCNSLTSIIIPDSVTTIGSYAFYNCTSLTDVYYEGTEEQWNNISIGSNNSPLTNATRYYYSDCIHEGESNHWRYDCDGNISTELTVGDWIVDVEPTCTTNGSKHKICAVCGTITVEIAALGHNWVWVVDTPATVTESGLKHEECSVCHVKQNENTIIDVIGYAEGLAYSINDDGETCTITGIGSCTQTDILIPEEIDGYVVTTIGEYAFNGCTSLTSIVIPDSVTTIGVDAFYNCSSLTGVYYLGTLEQWCGMTFEDYPMYSADNINLYIDGELLAGELVIPGTVTEIKAYAFYKCDSLTSVTFGENSQLTTIGDSAFSVCTNLTSITIPNSVTTIGSYAFSNCDGLTSVTFGENSQLTSIGNSAFNWCDGLTKVIIGGIESWYKIEFGDIYANPLHYAEHLYIGENEATNVEFVIPDGVTEIKPYAFYNIVGLTNITIPNSVNNIGEGAFTGCSITKATMPTTAIRHIPQNDLQIVVLTGGTSIASWAFGYCYGLTSITIPNSVTTIGDYAFANCYKLVEVYNKSSITITAGSTDNGRVGQYALNVYTEEDGSKLSIDSNGYIIYIDDEDKILVGYASAETDLVLPSGITEIYKYAFSHRERLTSVVIPDGVTSIGDYAFERCRSLTNVTIGNNVTTIGDDAFNYCTGLTSIVIPDSVTSIGSHAFWNCSSLTSITIPFVGATKDGTSNTHFGYIFGASGSSWQDDYIPSSLKEVVITGGTSIGDYAFESCPSLTSVTIGDGVTTIGGSAFSFCSGLTSIVIYDSVTTIDAFAFSGCDSLTDVYYTGTEEQWNAISIGSTNDYLTGAIIHYNYETLTLINGTWGNLTWTLDGTTGELIISGIGEMNSFLTSSNDAWRNYISVIKTVTIEDGVTNIGERAFVGCTSLISITIPSSVTSIADTAGFANSVRLVEVINYSSLELTIGSQTHGSVAYYALEVHDGESKLTDVDGFVFYSCNDVNYLVDYRGTATDLVLPANFNGQNYKINKGVFYECTSLTSVKIPDSVTNIDICTFYGCTSLKSVTFGENSQLTSVGNSAFRGCTSLTSVKIPDSVTSIDIQAFYGCSSLSSIVIPDSVTRISKQAFGDCTSLTSITFEDPNGWYVKETAYTTSGTNLTLTNSSTNATYFTSTYADYYWHKL